MIESIYEYVIKIIIVFFVTTNAGGELGFAWGARVKGQALRQIVTDAHYHRFNIDVVMIYVMAMASIYVFGDIIGITHYRMLTIFGIMGGFVIGLVLGFGYFVERERKLYKKS